MSKQPVLGGIYYIVRIPSGWQLVTYYFKHPEDDANHYLWWEDSVAGVVEKAWAKRSKVSLAKLRQELPLLCYAFPRGRLSKVGGGFIMLHGANVTRAMGISKGAIEKAFGVEKQCRWEFDEHEQCDPCDKEAMRQLLKIKEDWLAVSPDP